MKNFIKVVFIFIFCFLPISSFAWDDCPRGEVECEGLCGGYVDTDNDGICDRSQLAPEDREVIENVVDVGENNKTAVVNDSKNNKSVYNFFPVSIILLLLYFFTYVLVKTKKLKLITHRKIWNWLLLLSFIGCGISGILLVIKINYGLAWSFPGNLLFLHVETGIVMAIISIFHIFWHWAYYFPKLFRKIHNK